METVLSKLKAGSDEHLSSKASSVCCEEKLKELDSRNSDHDCL